MILTRPVPLPHLISSTTRTTLHGAARRRYVSGSAVRRDGVDHRASDKLLEDATREEAEAAKTRPSRVQLLEDQDQKWTGDESVRDAVLRMLADKYKPLRSGSIRSADEKLKVAPPKISTLELGHEADLPSEGSPDSLTSDIIAPSTPRKYVADEPILPGIEGHQPWHTTFKVPSHATLNVHYGHIPRRPFKRADPLPIDDKERRKQKETRRQTEHAGRLSRARESTLDYRLGIRGGPGGHRPNPSSLKGWASLVEDKIQRARERGLFNNVHGRGHPLASNTQDTNPFIGREEFLMNRIVQRQGAAPPWVEIQGELENAIANFRDIIKQSWTRRAIRLLTADQPASQLPKLALAEIGALRDAEWEARERAFHDHALDEVNAIVRKYNGLAPCAVRRAYYTRDTELEKAYRDAAGGILRGLAERAASSSDGTGSVEASFDDNDKTALPTSVAPLAPLNFRQMFTELWTTWRGR